MQGSSNKCFETYILKYKKEEEGGGRRGEEGGGEEVER
jgi:hypothetical protein